jgi:YHS domain-containing protein
MRFLILFAVGATVATAAMAGDQPAPEKPGVEQQAKAGNNICPVSGDKIGSVGKPIYVDYQGKRIALCCKDCAKDFKKNPAKYASLAEKNSSDSSSSSMSH